MGLVDGDYRVFSCVLSCSEMVELLLLSRPLLLDQRLDEAWILLMLQELPDLDRSRASVGALAHVIV